MKYEIRRELAPDNETWMDTAYSTIDGGYIGLVEDAVRLCDNRGIAPELIDDGYSVCTVGFCEREQKWYGWSHRAIYGFTIGSTVSKGDCAYRASTPEELIAQHVAFFSDVETDTEKLIAQCTLLPHRRGILINHPPVRAKAVIVSCISEAIESLSADLAHEDVELCPARQEVVLCGKGEWTAETLDDARQMACDFAKGVR